MYKRLEVKNNKILLPKEYRDFFIEDKLAMVNYDFKKIYLISDIELKEYYDKVSEYYRKMYEQKIINYQKYHFYLRTFCTKFCYYLNKLHNNKLLLPENALLMVGINKYLYLTENNNHLEIYKDENDILLKK